MNDLEGSYPLQQSCEPGGWIGAVPSFLFGVSCFEFRVSGSGFRVSGFGFRVSGFEFRVSGFGFRGQTDDTFVRVDAQVSTP